jgi:hypothetical protein
MQQLFALVADARFVALCCLKKYAGAASRTASRPR